jgi:hypothetical protein
MKDKELSENDRGAAWQRNGMGLAWTRHGLYELAFNILAPEFFLIFLAHPVCKM